MFSSPFIVPVTAVAFGIVGGLLFVSFMMWLKHKEKLAEPSSLDETYKAEIESLRQRVAALETIAASGKEELRREIDSL